MQYMSYPVMLFNNTRSVQYSWSTRLNKNKQVVKMERIMRFHCSASGEGAVDRKLFHKSEHGSKEAMNHNLWPFSPRLFA